MPMVSCQATHSAKSWFAIWYYILSALSKLGDSVFNFVAITLLLGMNRGGFLAAIFTSVEHFTRIALSAFFARQAEKVTLSTRLKWLVWLQPILALAAITPSLVMESPNSMVILFFATVCGLRVLNVLEIQMKADLSISLDASGVIEISKASALSNLANRGVEALGPIIAIAIAGMGWIGAATINALTYLVFGTLAAKLAFKISSGRCQPHIISEPIPKPPVVACATPLAWWYVIDITLFNLCFGGLSLLLVHVYKISKTHPTFHIMSPTTALYIGLCTCLMVGFIFPVTKWVRRRNLTLILYANLILTGALAALAAPNTTTQLASAFFMGLAYGWILLWEPVIVLRQLAQTAYFLRYIGYAASLGRLGSILSTFMVGVLIDQMNSLVTQVLCIAGMGIICLAILTKLRKLWQL